VTHHRRRRTCPTGKVRYRDHEAAVNALYRLAKSSTRDDVPRRSYLCPVCKGWHVTKKRERVIARERK